MARNIDTCGNVKLPHLSNKVRIWLKLCFFLVNSYLPIQFAMGLGPIPKGIEIMMSLGDFGVYELDENRWSSYRKLPLTQNARKSPNLFRRQIKLVASAFLYPNITPFIARYLNETH
ncbi:MAG: hypothetical protein MJY93_02820 [Fibrobacter sp.]|nr:hypothetical protein [Fibrobacter sp.]